ncbi:Lin1244/Lin1753 domain-containing protein [Bacteroides sp. 51]|uniref:DUF7833 domain-containing protein n=1 Tax=Bacteroides sp. 51 TaxID=2302938 RepID=UPI0013D30F3E|nr:Lin1244/Lin1753 domain-containing protein [Bacteroides sp. 51]NDV84705.1 DUF4373 domain-containing protein [Bacteroides sp. 51]
MKAKLYFPFEVNMINGSKVAELIETQGAKGFGVYILILIELRNSVNYQCSPSAIKGMARRCKISQKTLKRVLYDSGLFEFDLQQEGEIISAPYMDRAMGAYEEKIRKNARAGKKNADKAKRNARGQFTIGDGSIEENRIEKNKTTTSTTNVVEEKQEQQMVFNSDINAGTNTTDTTNIAGAGLESWETYLDLATQDKEWMTILAMNSGISKLFLKYQERIIEAFRKHVRLQGSGSSQQSVGDIKAYFANFMRPGTPTHSRVAGLLALLDDVHNRAGCNPYETFDAQTGKRSYYGNPIPADAPPRPNDNAVWSPQENQWI